MDKLKQIKDKIILKKEDAYNLLNTWKFKEDKIVFSNGCFDIIHRGHLEYLASAASLGNKMIIGLNSDSSTQRLKGPSRPINDEYSRALLLASLSFVNLVILFEEDTPYNLINFIQPDILVKGGDSVSYTHLTLPTILRV